MKGFLEKLVQRRVVANVVMAGFILGGIRTACTIRQEIMPVREERAVEIEIALDGASPEGIEAAILVPVEEAVRGVGGVKHVVSEAFEGAGTIRLALLRGADPQQVLGEVKKELDHLETLPRHAEAPVVSIPMETEKVMSIIVHGNQPWLWLQRAAEGLRSDLRTHAGLTRVELAHPRRQEVSVEVSGADLRHLGLTLEEVAGRIGSSALEAPAGTLRTEEADVALRASLRREWARDFGSVVVAENEDGIPLRLEEIASIKDDFGDSTLESWFNGEPAVQLDVYAVGDETPVGVEAAVRDFLAGERMSRYDGVGVHVFENAAEDYRRRRGLLVSDALTGLALVLLILGVFLAPRPAFWVIVGIPTALLGGLLLTPLFGATFNMLSMFAFIVTIGVVVDDAIMIAEAIHAQREKGAGPVDAAVAGLREVGAPVLLATATTIAAFLPIFFVPGEMGIMFLQIPAVVVSVLLVSLLEAVFILPAHLVHERKHGGWFAALGRPSRRVSGWVERFVQGPYRHFMAQSLRHPAGLVAGAISAVLVTAGAMGGGWLSFDFVPTVAADTVTVQATMPYGTPKARAVEMQRRLVEAGQRVLAEHGMETPGLFSCVGARLDEGELEVETLGGSHYLSVLMALPPPGERPLSGREVAEAWRVAFGEPAGVEAVSFSGEKSITGGEPMRFDVSHPDTAVARAAAVELGDGLRGCSGLTSVDDGVRVGKPELRLALKPDGIPLGMTTEALAEQVRHRFHGAEALRLVRDGSEVRVMVRLTEAERADADTLSRALLTAPDGRRVPLSEVAEITRAHSFTRLARRDGRRIFPVTADVRLGVDDDEVEDVIEDEIIPRVQQMYPGTRIREGEEEEESEEALASLGSGFVAALGLMYLLLAFQFNSYVQPLLVLSTIPLSLIGALWGHVALGQDLSIVSVIGILAMAGVVVNDSVVLMDAYNRHRAAGQRHRRAILEGACRRFRPILLTSLTTFVGLVPMMFERSEQAQFLVPAALSLGFGLAFGTLITLTIVPLLILAFQRPARPPCPP